ncbi:EAL domain-containing protein [Erwiniaceae bacterium CAU 1747]
MRIQTMSGTFSNDDVRRLAALEMLKSEDAIRDDILQKFTLLASELLAIPDCFVSVLNNENQYIKAACCLDTPQSSLHDAFCRQVALRDKLLICGDTLLDPRFSQNPFTLGTPFIRFFAGVPLQTREGVPVGTLCITDTQPHAFDAHQSTMLELLADLIGGYLDAWYTAGYKDVVTQLPNRQRLLKDIGLLQRASSFDPLTLTLIDCIDMPRVYEIARSMGVDAVETLLKALTATVRCRLNLAEDDVLYAVATGRFALVSPKNSTINAQALSERLENIRAQVLGDITIDVKIHVGEVSFVPAISQVTEVLRQAVSALHEAISQKQTAMAYNADSDNRRNLNFQLLNDLALALRGSQGLYLVYQPQLCLHTGKPIGLEALLRWQHPVAGNISPAEFIPLAEHTSLMDELTDWVIDHALIQLSIWRKKGLNLPVSVNLSVSDFSRPKFAAGLAEKTRRAGLDAGDLTLECLETQQVLESNDACQGLYMLKQCGFRIALDDFGSGYNNINTLRRIPVDIIKLDRSLIQQLNRDPASEVIARHTITMLKELNYVVLAEGVEDLQTLASLQHLGCDEIQGFYYSHPLPPDKLEHWFSHMAV